MIYSTAKEFAEYIKRDLYQFQIEPEDIDLRKEFLSKHYKEQFKTSNFKLDRNFNEVNTMFQEVVDGIIKVFFEILPESTKNNFKGHFYFSTIDNRKINASIFRSNDKKFFAIFINSALINLLTKLGKLDMALMNPECIVFCSRFPNTLPSKNEIKVMREEMYNYFISEKMSHGPYLIIKGNEANTHFNKLDIQEKLIIFHEIGHFLNGDLFSNKENQITNPQINNIHHQREYLADLVGFGLLLKLERKNGEISIERRLMLLNSIINLFDVMYGLQNEETNKYPLPLNRMNMIIEYFYGINIAEIVEKTYYDKNEWKNLLPSTCPPIESREKEIDIVIDRAFVSAFDKEKWV